MEGCCGFRDTVGSSFVRPSADRNITAPSSPTEGLLSARCSLLRNRGEEEKHPKRKSREEVTAGGLCSLKISMQIAFVSASLISLPCPTPSAEMIHHRLATSSEVRLKQFFLLSSAFERRAKSYKRRRVGSLQNFALDFKM